MSDVETKLRASGLGGKMANIMRARQETQMSICTDVSAVFVAAEQQIGDLTDLISFVSVERPTLRRAMCSRNGPGICQHLERLWRV